MVPTFLEMMLELIRTEGMLIYKGAQAFQWGVIKDGMYLMSVDERDPSDEFLKLWIELDKSTIEAQYPVTLHLCSSQTRSSFKEGQNNLAYSKENSCLSLVQSSC